MTFLSRSAVVLLFVVSLCGSLRADEKSERDKLKGGWNAIALERGGKQAPVDAIKLMRFTFRDKELLIRGNFQDETEASCKYKIDPSKTPKRLEFTPPGKKEPVLAIYRIKDGKLEICSRNSGKPTEPPTEFKTGDDRSLVLVKFEREKAKK